MPTAEAHLTTDRASRYLVQLCRHLGQMNRMGHGPLRGHSAGRTMPAVQHVDCTETHGVVRFAEGEWTLDATAETLRLRVEADNEQALQRLQDGISARIEKIGRRDGLQARWRRTEADAEADALVHTEPGAAGGALTTTGNRNRGKALGLVAGAVVIALHLGLGGAALADATWTGWTANAVLVLILVKLMVMGGHLALRRAAPRRGAVSRRRRKQNEPAGTDITGVTDPR